MAKVGRRMRAANTKAAKADAATMARAPRAAKPRAASKKPSRAKAPAKTPLKTETGKSKAGKAAKPLVAKQPKAAAATKPPKKPASLALAAAPPAFNLSEMLAQSAWVEADDALARALRDFAALERVSQRLSARLRDGAFAADAGAVEDMMLAASQSLRQAGRKRGMQRFGDLGAIVSFDPALHDLAKPSPKPPAMVKILSQGVQRGGGAHIDVIVKAIVTPLRRRASLAAQKG